MKCLIEETGGKVEYIETVDSRTLKSIDVVAAGCRVLIAAHYGKTRLIDNRVLADWWKWCLTEMEGFCRMRMKQTNLTGASLLCRGFLPVLANRRQEQDALETLNQRLEAVDTLKLQSLRLYGQDTVPVHMEMINLMSYGQDTILSSSSYCFGQYNVLSLQLLGFSIGQARCPVPTIWLNRRCLQ